jgi:hypothetical protein
MQYIFKLHFGTVIKLNSVNVKLCFPLSFKHENILSQKYHSLTVTPLKFVPLIFLGH